MGMIRKLKRYCQVKKVLFQSYDFICHHKENIFHIKTIKFHGEAIVTFHSRTHLSVKTGKVKSGRFVTKKETIISLEEFSDIHQGVIVFDQEPFKLYKQLNESDLEEITGRFVHHYTLVSKEEDLIALLD